MTSPSGDGGLFHFRQDIDVALAEIRTALERFPGQVDPLSQRINEALFFGVGYDQASFTNFISQLEGAVAEAESVARQAGPGITEALSAGLDPKVAFERFQAAAVSSVAKLQQIFHEGLAKGLIPVGVAEEIKGLALTVESAFKKVAGGLPGGVGVGPSGSGEVGAVSSQTRALIASTEKLISVTAAEAAAKEGIISSTRALERAQKSQATAIQRQESADDSDRNEQRNAVRQYSEALKRSAKAQEALDIFKEQAAAASIARSSLVEAATQAVVDSRTRAAGGPPASTFVRSPSHLETELDPQQLLDESTPGNSRFRNPLLTGGIRTVHLGGNNFARITTQDQISGDEPPTFYRARPGFEGKDGEAEGPSAVRVDPAVDPVGAKNLNDKFQSQERVASQSARLVEQEQRLGAATDLAEKQMLGLAIRLGETNLYYDDYNKQILRLSKETSGPGRGQLGATVVSTGDQVAADLADARQKAVGPAISFNKALDQENAALVANAEALELATRKTLLASELRSGDAIRTRNGEIRRLNTGELFDSNARPVTDPLRLQRAEVPGRTQKGGLESFFGGLTSKGFNSEGDESPGLTGIFGTAGNLVKYAAVGKAIQDTFRAVNSVKEQTILYQAALTELDIALEATHGGQVDLNEAVTTGLSVNLDASTAITVGSQAIRGYSEEIRNGASAADVLTNSIQAAGVAALITGQNAADAEKQLRAVTAGQGLKSTDQARINDAVTNAKKNFGGNSADILQALGVSAEASSQAGISVEQQANIASLIQRSTGQAGNAVGGDINRLVSRAANPQFLKALDQAGVQNTGNIGAEIIGLSEHYNKLSKSAQQAFERNIAGGRSLGFILPILREASLLTDANAKSAAGGGAANQEAALRLASFAQELKHVGAELKTIAAEIGQSGIFLPLVAALKAVEPLISGLDDLLRTFNEIPKSARLVTVGVLEAAGAFLFLRKVGGLSGLRDAISPRALSKGAEGPAVVAAVDAETAALENQVKVIQSEIVLIEERNALLADARLAVTELSRELVAKNEILATDERLLAAEGELAQLEKDALVAEIALLERKIILKEELIAAGGVQATEQAGGLAGVIGGSFIGGKGGLLKAGLIAAVGGAAIDSTLGAQNSQLSLSNKAEDLRANANFGSVEDIQSSIRNLRDNSTALDKSTSGITGAIVNFADKFLTGTNASDQKGRNEAEAGILSKIAEELSKAQTNAALGVNGSDLAHLVDGQTPGGVDAGFKILTESGRSATTQLKAVSDNLALLGENAAQAAIKLGPIDQQTAALKATGSLVARTTGDADLFREVADTSTYTFPAGFPQPDLRGHPTDDENRIRAGIVSDSKTLGKFAGDTNLQSGIQKTVEDYLKAGGVIDKAGKAKLLENLKQQAHAYRDALKTPKARDAFDANLSAFLNDIQRQLDAASGAGKLDPAARALAIAQDAAGLISKASATGAEQGSLFSLGKDLDPRFAKTIKEEVGPNASGKRVADQVILDQLNKGLVDAQKAIDSAKTADEKDKLKASIEALTAARDAALVTVASDVQGQAQAALVLLNSGVPIEDSFTQAKNTLASLIKQRDAATDPAIKAGFQAQINTQSQNNSQSAIDLAAAQANVKIDPADRVNLAQQAVKDAQAQVDLFKTRKDTTSKAYLDAVFKVNKLTEDAALAVVAQANVIGLSKIDVRDTVAVAGKQLENDIATFKATPVADAQGRAAASQKVALDRLALARATTEREDARRNSTVLSSDEVAKATQALSAAQAILAIDEVGTTQYFKDLRAVNDAKFNLARANNALANAREEAGISPGSAIQAATAKLDAANLQLAIEHVGTVDYYKALAAVHSAQNDVANAQLDGLKILDELGTDTTNPVAQADVAARNAKRKLEKDRARGAGSDVIGADILDVERTAAAAQKSLLDQQLSLHATQFQLRQISAHAYISFLRDQDKSLREQLAVTGLSAQGRQQLVDELNTVDSAIQGLNNQLQGQFNLGTVKLPTVFQVRNALGVSNDPSKDPTFIPPLVTAVTSIALPAVQAAQGVNSVSSALTGLALAASLASTSGVLASGKLSQSTQSAIASTINHVNINGADIQAVINYLNTILGTAAQTQATTGRKGS